MSNLTLEQVGILEALAIAEVACRDAIEMIAYHPTDWVKGRNEGHTMERLSQCQQMLGATQIALKARMEWT